MTAPKPGPLDVECPTCEEPPRKSCRAADMPWPGPRVKPHAARIRAAQKAREEGKK